MSAVVAIGGKQYHVEVNKVIKVERIGSEVGQVIKLESVLAYCDSAADVDLSKVSVTATVLEHRRAPKIIVFKKKRRHNYRRKKGHKQNISVLRIVEITAA